MASHSLAAAEMDTINTEVGMLASKIEKVEEEVAEVKEKVAKVESALRGGEPYLGISDRQQLLARLGALEKKEEQLRKEKEQLREKELRLLPASSPPAASGIFEVQASIKGCKKLKGVRPLIYRGAEDHQAFHKTPNRASSISYEGDDLKISLAFKAEEAAMRFQTFLRNLNAGEPVVRLQGAVTLSNLECIRGPTGEAVARSHYDANASDSPTTTLADMAGSSRSGTHASTVAQQSDLFEYQSLENPAIGRASKFEKAHIKDKAECTADEAKDENNLLALSPLLHQCFDGDGFRNGVAQGTPPSIAIQAVDTHEDPTTPEHPTVKGRHRVRLLIECFGTDAVETVQPNLKNGTISTGGVFFLCDVHVKDPQSFREYVAWKYKRVKDVWKGWQDLP